MVLTFYRDLRGWGWVGGRVSRRRSAPVRERESLGGALAPAFRASDSSNKGEVPMARFLLEVPHEPEVLACAQAIEIFLRTGSHFLTHADWGCMDGDHKAWLIVEVDSKAEARVIIPPALATQARIVQLNAFTLEQVEEIRRQHKAKQ